MYNVLQMKDSISHLFSRNRIGDKEFEIHKNIYSLDKCQNDPIIISIEFLYRVLPGRCEIVTCNEKKYILSHGVLTFISVG